MFTVLTTLAWMIAAATWLMLMERVGDAQLAAGANRIDDFWNGTTADTAPLGAERWRPVAIADDQVSSSRQAWGALSSSRGY